MDTRHKTDTEENAWLNRALQRGEFIVCVIREDVFHLMPQETLKDALDSRMSVITVLYRLYTKLFYLLVSESLVLLSTRKIRERERERIRNGESVKDTKKG